MTTTEEVDEHLAKDEHKKALTVKEINLCAVYVAVRPIIKFARALLFFKPKWQTAIDKFIAALDATCPVN